MFTNESSREYQFYNIVVTVTPSVIVETLTFECRAREMAQREISIKNPLSEEGNFFVKCKGLYCNDALRINGNSEVNILTSHFIIH